MNASRICRPALLALLLAGAASAAAGDREDYNRRAAAADLALFHELDRNGDGAVTREEARGDVDFLPRFDDMELDMDGNVTPAELQRYLEKQYGIPAHASTARSANR